MIHSGTPGVKAAARPTPRIGVPFAPIPLDVKARRDVSPAAKLVFATLANQARLRRAEVSNLTNRRIAERAGLSVAAVRRALDELEARGLARRLFGESKRIRLGIAVTYAPAGVAQPGATPPADGVAHRAQPGCSTPPDGGCAPAATDLPRTSEERPETISPALGDEDREAAALFAQLGPAGFLRAMVAKGREEAAAAKAAPRPPATRVLPPPPPSQDAIRAAVGSMVGSLAEGFAAGRPGRRMSPRQLQAQLAEVRRRYGKGRPGA
jgi:hypothetical protein